jgi:hypothetical protein
MCYTDALARVYKIVVSGFIFSMPIQMTSKFVAVGKALINDEWLPVTITGNRTKFGPEPVKCSVLLDLSLKESWLNKLTGLSTHLTQFQGQTVDGYHIWATDFEQEIVTAYSTMIKWEGTAKRFIESNTGDINVINGEVTYSIFLPPIPLTSVDPKHSSDAISLEGNDEYEFISWNTETDRARLIYSNLYLEETIGMDKAIVKVQKYEIKIQRNVSNASSIIDLFNNLDEKVNDAITLISFICRKYVEWYAAQVNYIINTSCRDYNLAEAILYRLTSSAYRVNQLIRHAWDADTLIRKEHLATDIFQKILKNYTKFKYKHMIHQTILYLLKSYEDNYLEIRLANLYSALETLVDGLSKENDIVNSLGNGDFKKLSRRLRQVIKDELEGDPLAAEDVIKKLSELQRRSFIDRWLELLRIYSVDSSLNWLLENSFASAPRTYETSNDILSLLSAVLKRRNNYIHQGILDNEHCIADLRLIQTLIELWILKLLDCPDSTIEIEAFKSFSFGPSIS